MAAWVIQLLALLLAASGGSPRAWAPRNSPPARLFLLDQGFGSLRAVFWLLLPSPACEELMTGYRLEPQRCRDVVREGFVPLAGAGGEGSLPSPAAVPCVP